MTSDRNKERQERAKVEATGAARGQGKPREPPAECDHKMNGS